MPQKEKKGDVVFRLAKGKKENWGDRSLDDRAPKDGGGRRHLRAALTKGKKKEKKKGR